MNSRTVCVVDYHMGNHASVVHSLRELNYRVRVSNDPAVLNEADVLVIPGVGAFPSGMKALHNLSLVSYLQEQARLQRPIIGFCLGMQLLADASYEHQYTMGLGLIPGEVVPLLNPQWHIGWNSVECVLQDPLFQASDGQVFYFNHSFAYRGPSEYQIGQSRHHNTFPSVIRRGSVVGLQFHPEKSQGPGRGLLKSLISGLCHA